MIAVAVEHLVAAWHKGLAEDSYLVHLVGGELLVVGQRVAQRADLLAPFALTCQHPQ